MKYRSKLVNLGPLISLTLVQVLRAGPGALHDSLGVTGKVRPHWCCITRTPSEINLKMNELWTSSFLSRAQVVRVVPPAIQGSSGVMSKVRAR